MRIIWTIYRAKIPGFYPVIPAKAGIQKATDACDEPKIGKETAKQLSIL